MEENKSIYKEIQFIKSIYNAWISNKVMLFIKSIIKRLAEKIRILDT